MRRLGTILMILGVNLAIGSAVAAFYLASFDCALMAAEGQCREGTGKLFIDLMTSGEGLIYWLVIMIGAAIFWRGKQLRARTKE